MTDWIRAATALAIGLSLASISIEPAFSPATLAALIPSTSPAACAAAHGSAPLSPANC